MWGTSVEKYKENQVGIGSKRYGNCKVFNKSHESLALLLIDNYSGGK